MCIHLFLGAELELSTLLTDCFSTMRGSVADMLPSGWELSPTQSLTGADPNLMAQREKDYFMCVDGTVFSKEFAAKAQAMKTVSLGQVSSAAVVNVLLCYDSNFSMEHRTLLVQSKLSPVRVGLYRPVRLCLGPTASRWKPSAPSSMNMWTAR